MTDERRLSPLDRRQLLPRAGGRRRTDVPADHATRARYQAGCRCTPCKAANAAYEALYRDKKRTGQPMEGSRVSAVETWRKLRVLKGEYTDSAKPGTLRAVSARLGYQNGHVQIGRRLATLRNVLKVRDLYQLDILDGLGDGESPDGPV